MRTLKIVLVCLLAATIARADYLEVRRPANLKDQPAPDATVIQPLHEGQYLRLLSDTQQNGYYQAEPYTGGQAGWIYRTLVRRWPGDPEGVTVEPTPAESAPSGSSGAVPSTGAPDDASAFPIPNCPPEGNPSPRGPRFDVLKALNRQKNRMVAPTPAEAHATPLSSFLTAGPDDSRWSSEQGVEVIGYVADVKSGGKETCNCRNPDPRYYDTHIELSSGSDDQGLPMIVEVTPAWRALMATRGKDWTTESLKATIRHQWVRVRGWLLWDGEHRQNAENTNPDGDHLWRRTAWEIHPITGLEVVPAPAP